MNGSHVGFVPCLGKGFCREKLSRYQNSDSTFQLTWLFISWDINLNPSWTGHWEKELLFMCTDYCSHHRSLACNLCGLRYHIECGRVTPKRFKEILENVSITWTCSLCPQHPKQGTGSDLNLFSFPLCVSLIRMNRSWQRRVHQRRLFFPVRLMVKTRSGRTKASCLTSYINWRLAQRKILEWLIWMSAVCGTKCFKICPDSKWIKYGY